MEETEEKETPAVENTPPQDMRDLLLTFNAWRDDTWDRVGGAMPFVLLLLHFAIP